MIAVDVSRWSATGGVISRQVWRTLKRDHNVRLAIVGAWHGLSENPGARVSLENALHEGLLIHTYTVLNSRDGWRSVQIARDIIGGAIWQEIGCCWLDCEIDGIQLQTIRDGFGLLDRWDKPSGIYTARWWWVDHFGNPTNFRGRPLWNAVYDHDPDVDFPRYPYGGWTLEQVYGEQYTGTSYVAGIFVDWNFFYDHKVIGGQKMENAEIERRLNKNERAIQRESQLRQAAGIWGELEALAHSGQSPDDELVQQARYLLAAVTRQGTADESS